MTHDARMEASKRLTARIRRELELHQMTIQDLSAHSGVDRGNLSRYLADRQPMSFGAIVALGAVFDLEPDYRCTDG